MPNPATDPKERTPTRFEVRDMLPARRRTETYSLRDLTRCIFGMDIQQGPHDAFEDAKATMNLYTYGTMNGSHMSKSREKGGHHSGRNGISTLPGIQVVNKGGIIIHDT